MDRDELEEIARRFGVAPEQVERDHLISYLLAFLGANFGERIQFIGGTALARTHLPEGRLSEDVDLIAVGDRNDVAADLDAALPRALARTHGRVTVDPPLIGLADVDAAILRSAAGISVRIQLLSARGRVPWPSERRTLERRYRDAPTAELIVPTLPAFAASKTVTWADRRAPRDLWDLWALSRIGAIDAAASKLYRRFGPTNQPPADYLFKRAPTDAQWQTQLAGQTRLTITAAEALATVRQAWARVADDGRGRKP
ncbi:nucleotidyl transferase AbiEii/AbiGii toxin family protein [Mycolicibacterium moriokaense]|uniref:Putative nucleotidyltransferase component of viral defense system n=1 Tax=Mycolicibacterium moriokaense TaxID=39691 RepID=A0A318HI08_9MYCO|nr:nucleotidyl transferase AbiEii/AbiGii toxin family protein [Mycolicibacterium moriokaense]PXX09229.1 putative nucleotidyltransferase component of viral defense system [Mycolicibacterium moriokaense]